jgi:CRISPR-associated protein Cas2
MRDALFVYAYDIASNRVRRRVAERLERHGARVQESVFEVRASQEKAEALLSVIDIELAAGDRVRMYAIPEDGRVRSRQIGGAPIAEAQEFWLL